MLPFFWHWACVGKETLFCEARKVLQIAHFSNSAALLLAASVPGWVIILPSLDVGLLGPASYLVQVSLWNLLQRLLDCLVSCLLTCV